MQHLCGPQNNYPKGEKNPDKRPCFAGIHLYEIPRIGEAVAMGNRLVEVGQGKGTEIAV
jgi:hypothetical protein